MCKRHAVARAELPPQYKVNQDDTGVRKTVRMNDLVYVALVCEPSTQYSIVKKKELRVMGKHRGNRPLLR